MDYLVKISNVVTMLEELATKAKDLWDKYDNDAAAFGVMSAYAAAAKQVKSIPPEQQWIPCSKRLPSAHEEVIVSCLDDSGDTEYAYTSCGWLTIDKKCWIVDNEENSFVKAWMPRPEPYKENGEENV